METFQRIIATLLFVPLLYIGLANNFYHALYFSLGVFIIGFLAYRELKNILALLEYQHTFLVPLALALTYMSFFYQDFTLLHSLLILFFMGESIYWIVCGVDFKKMLSNIFSGIFIVFYLGILWGSAILLRQWNGGQIFPTHGYVLGAGHFIILLVGTWACDIGAYFGGRLLGKTKLNLPISPNKTLEGFISGILFSWVCLYFTVHVIQFSFYWIMLLIPFTTIAGDLFESLMKRASNIKDSSRLIPGHGGILDIFDALIFSIPAYYFLILPWIEV